jgi:hypothetical protein
MNKVIVGILLAAAAIIVGVIVGKSFHDEVLDNDDDDYDDEDFENFFGNNEGDIDIEIKDTTSDDNYDTMISD